MQDVSEARLRLKARTETDRTVEREEARQLLCMLAGAAELPAACLAATTYAIYKPRGVVSATSDPDPRMRTLTDVMLAAGVEPLPGHVGRLDLETGGLILVTADSLLLRAAIQWGPVVESHGAAELPKVYVLLLAGRHEADDERIASLREPLVHRFGGREWNSDGATVSHLRCFQDADLANEYGLLDRDDAESVAQERAALRAARQPSLSRATGELVPPFVPFDGWLTEVELSIHQGRHRQIRRLCKRAKLELRHLRRVSVGPVKLGQLGPGEVRPLGEAEKRGLYQALLPIGGRGWETSESVAESAGYECITPRVPNC